MLSKKKPAGSQSNVGPITKNRRDTNIVISKPPVHLFTAWELGRMQFPPIRYIVPGLFPEGATILAGRPKLGKSWLALDVALAVSNGGAALGVKCEQGAVLYLAFEDNMRRLYSRIQRISSSTDIDPWINNLTFATRYKRHDAGGLEDIRTWAASVERPRLVVVDVLAAFRGGRRNIETQYEADYSAVSGLQEIAGDLQLAVLIVHHVRKTQGEGGDPFEKVSGTLGLTGAADTTLILDRDSNGSTLYGRGRDIEEFEKAVSFDKLTCRWQINGEAADFRRSDTRKSILKALSISKEPMGPNEVAKQTGLSNDNVKQALSRMVKAGEVERAGKGRYRHSESLSPPVT